MDNNYKEKYEKVCFSLEQANKELSEIYVNNFVLNPKIHELTNLIKRLNDEKTFLKNKIEEEEKKNEG